VSLPDLKPNVPISEGVDVSERMEMANLLVLLIQPLVKLS
jgi:hypothetical protein